jgi:mRNA (guanine-N7-)-methyltransferase
MSKQRKHSAIINLRSFHNWIKSQTILDAANYLRNTHSVNDIKLLDLAVGKGGDMWKWHNAKINNVVGIDIDDNSINGENGAKDRYKRFRFRGGKNYSFHVFDLSNPKNIPKIDKIIGDKKFNIISCQFALHYFFRSPEALNTFMTIATKYMDKHAFFVGTTMDGNLIKKMFDKHGILIEKDLYYFEKMDDSSHKDTAYNNTYKVALGQKEGEVHYFSEKASIEYMVDIEELKEVCKKYGLIFAGQQNFEEWYKNYPKKHKKPLSKEEQEFSFLNFSFAFKKK